MLKAVEVGVGRELLWCRSLEQQFWELGFGFHLVGLAVLG